METIRVHTVSLGCPKNRVDTERMLGAFGPSLVAAESPDRAEVILVNTCGFIRPAIEESVNVILDMAREAEAAETRPLVCVAGCLVSRFGQAELAPELPEVDLWLDTTMLDQWPGMIREALEARELHPSVDPSAPRALSTGPGYAYLKIGEGCGHNCRFCTIPSIRGPLVSVPLDALAEEAEGLIGLRSQAKGRGHGVPELVLVAQDTTSYGRDLGLDNGLLRLLERLAPLAEAPASPLEWIRLMYLYPAGLTDDLLSFLADQGVPGQPGSGPVLPYFDIPLQHAHPDILRTMGRPFARDPGKVLDTVRAKIPHAVFRTSIIVGYPGETDAHFQALAEFVEKARFRHLGVFAFEPEDGTPAAEMAGQVPDDVKEERRNALMEIQAEISRELLEDRIGERMRVLVEAPHPEWPGLFTGRTWFQAPEVDGTTYVSGLDIRPGTMVDADIENAMTYDLSALA